MLTIAVISQKGGAGKTTLAIHLGTVAHAAGLPTVIVDTDPQATASRWGKWRAGKDPDVIDCASHSLFPDKLVALARAGAAFAVIDTPPAADIMAREACRAASLLLIPCRPRAFDLGPEGPSVRKRTVAACTQCHGPGETWLRTVDPVGN